MNHRWSHSRFHSQEFLEDAETCFWVISKRISGNFHDVISTSVNDKSHQLAFFCSDVKFLFFYFEFNELLFITQNYIFFVLHFDFIFFFFLLFLLMCNLKSTTANKRSVNGLASWSIWKCELNSFVSLLNALQTQSSIVVAEIMQRSVCEHDTRDFLVVLLVWSEEFELNYAIRPSTDLFNWPVSFDSN